MKNVPRVNGLIQFATLLGLGCTAIMIGAPAQAGCGQYDKPTMGSSMWNGMLGDHDGMKMIPVALSTEGDNQGETALPPLNSYAVVGLWKVLMTAKGNPKIPDGTEIDFGYQTWHSDGTELLNSGGRAPISGDICTGVWVRTSYHHYRLNHVTLGWDPTGKVFVGPGTIKEEIVVDESLNRFAGEFEIIQYSLDETTVLADIKGVVTGTRVKP